MRPHTPPVRTVCGDRSYEGTVRAPVADPVARCIAALFGHRQNLRDERVPPRLEAELA